MTSPDAGQHHLAVGSPLIEVQGEAHAGQLARAQCGSQPTRGSMIERLSGFAGCLLVAGAIVGCGGAGAIARDVGVAACRQAASSLADPQARQIADQACQAGASGSVRQATQAAEQAARNACLTEAGRIVDPLARQQIAALCPAVK